MGPRVLLAILLALSTAAGAPYVRWIDQTGEVRREEIREVLAESPSRVEVRLPDGKALQLQARNLLGVVRERESDPEERALLQARVAALSGGDPGPARKTLDRLAEHAGAEWVREYAKAARVLLAERAGEKDALERIERFLKEHPDSRWVSRLYLARGRLKARRDPEQVTQHMVEAHTEIGRVKGPLLLRYQVIVEDMRTALELDLAPPDEHLKWIGMGIANTLEETDDVVSFLLAESAMTWVKLAIEQAKSRQVQAHGAKPKGPLVNVARLRDQSSLLLPELRSDLQRELGMLLRACGEPERARAELEKALELAPDPVRRALARRALEAQRR
jgi:tetratricopeptide (TPR) repeat protein